MGVGEKKITTISKASYNIIHYYSLTKKLNLMRALLIIIGLAIIAATVYFSSLIWDAHRIIALLICCVGAWAGVKIMMADV